jgi:hypothetical protein
MLFACARVANNSLEPAAPSQEQLHGKRAMAQRQQAAAEQDEHKAKPKVDCASLTQMRSQLYFKSSISDDKAQTVKVGATGYGAPPKNYYPEGQRRLMTIRASKVDAYRALAEIVGGLHVWGGSAIGDMVIERDRFRTFIDSYVRGARIVSVEALDDDTYRTVVEMEVDQRFLHQVMTFIDPAAEKLCYEEHADGSKTQFGYSTAPSFYYSE